MISDKLLRAINMTREQWDNGYMVETYAIINLLYASRKWSSL